MAQIREPGNPRSTGTNPGNPRELPTSIPVEAPLRVHSTETIASQSRPMFASVIPATLIRPDPTM